MTKYKEKIKETNDLPINEHFTREIFRIVSIEKGRYNIKNKSYDAFAEISDSCVLMPCEDDVVTAIFFENCWYIDSIIKRSSVELREFKMKGKVFAGVDESNIQIAPDRITVKSSKISLNSQLLSIKSRISEWLMVGLKINAKLIEQKSKKQHIECEETYTVKAENSHEEIANIAYRTSKASVQRSDKIGVTTNKFNINT